MTFLKIIAYLLCTHCTKYYKIFVKDSNQVLSVLIFFSLQTNENRTYYHKDIFKRRRITGFTQTLIKIQQRLQERLIRSCNLTETASRSIMIFAPLKFKPCCVIQTLFLKVIDFC